MNRFSPFLLLVIITFGLQAQILQDLTKESGYNYGPPICIVSGPSALWIGGEKGLVRIDPSEASEGFFSGRPTSKPVLSLLDASTHLWTGIQGKGLYLFNKENYKFKGYFKKELGTSDILLMQDTEAGIVLLTRLGQAYKIRLTDTTISTASDQIKSSLTSSLSEKKTAVSFGGFSFSFNNKSVLKSNKNGNSTVVGATQLSDFKGLASAFREDFLVFLMRDGLLLYTASKDSIDFSMSSTQTNGGLLTKKMEKVSEQAQSTVGEQEEQTIANSTENETPCIAHNSANIWLLCCTFLIVLLSVFFGLRKKYRKDIKTLEAEILRLQQE